MAAREWATSSTRSSSRSCRAWMARSGIIVAAHNSLCTNHIYKFGTEEQKQKYVVAARAGEEAGLLVAHRAGGGIGRRAARAPSPQQRRDGGWVINGSKTFTTNGHYADVCVAMAVTDRVEEAARNFGVHRREGNSRVSSRARRKTSWACAPAIPAKLFSPIAACPLKIFSASEGEGFVNSLQILDGGRISIAAWPGHGAGRV